MTDKSVQDDFAIGSASFYLLGDGRLPGEQVSLVDGEYDEGDVHMRVDSYSDLIYTDLNGDGVLDVTAILEQVGREGHERD